MTKFKVDEIKKVHSHYIKTQFITIAHKKNT
jgi:hypothetical protein